MCVARTCARRRRQMVLDKRYNSTSKAKISRKLQGRAKLNAQRALTNKHAAAN